MSVQKASFYEAITLWWEGRGKERQQADWSVPCNSCGLHIAEQESTFQSVCCSSRDQVPRLQHGACPLLPGWGLPPLAPASPAVVSCQNKPHDADLKFSPYSSPDSSPTTTCSSGCANTIFMWFAEKLQNCAYDTFTVSASKHLIRGVIAATAAKRPRFGLVSKRATGTKGHLILAGQRSSCSRKESFAVTNTKHVHFTSPNQ